MILKYLIHCSDPASVEERQMRDALQVAGLPADTPMDGSDVELFRGYQHDFLQKAQAFDARFSSTSATPPAAPAAPVVQPQWTKMEQNGTSGANDRCASAIDAALAGIRQHIATVGA